MLEYRITSERAKSLRLPRVWQLIVFVLISTCLSASAYTQDETTLETANPLDPKIRERIAAQLKQIQESTELDPAVQEKAVQGYQQALAEFDQAKTFQTSIDSATASIKGIDTSTSDVQTEFDQTPNRVEPDYAADLDLDAIKTRVTELTASKETHSGKLQTLQQEQTRRESRIREIPGRKTAIEKSLPDLQLKLSALTQQDSLDIEGQATEESLRQQINRQEIELRWLDVEQRFYAAEANLLQLRIELADRKLRLTNEQLLLANKQQAELRKAEAERIADQIDELENRLNRLNLAPELFSDAVRMNEKRMELADLSPTVAEEKKTAENKLQQRRDEFAETQVRIEDVGITRSLGSFLRTQQSNLPDPAIIRNQIRDRQELVRKTELDVYQANELRKKYLLTPSSIENLMSRDATEENPNEKLTDDQITALRELSDLLTELSRSLQQEVDAYFQDLVDLNSTQKQEIEVIKAYGAFIDENILWIQSHQPLWKLSKARILAGLKWPFVNLQIRGQSKEQKKIPVSAFVGIIISLAIGFVLLLWQHRQIRRFIRKQSERVSRRSCMVIAPTFWALFATIAISLPWPFVILTIGAILTQMESVILQAAGKATAFFAAWYFCLEFARQSCRSGGLFSGHFHWPEESVSRFRVAMRSSMILVLPLFWIHEISRKLENDLVHDVLGRLFFLAGLLALTVWVIRTFRPRKGVFAHYLEENPEGWANRLRYIWMLLLVSIPISLFALCACGYFFSAEQLLDCLAISYAFVLGLVLVGGLINRWILVIRLRLRFQQLVERSQETSSSETVITGEMAAAMLETAPAVDLRELNEQSVRLVRNVLIIVGIFVLLMVWTPVLPALRGLDRVELWQVTGTADEIEIVTLRHVLLVLPLIIGTFILAKNAPGTFEMLVLQRLPLEQAIRYAITTLTRYAIVIIGIIIAASWLGIHWSHVQFLVAALGVGLGFGLQEVFANFVSGLILLFERPIRVGDVVTISDVTGVVTRIQIRATTIRNWDRQDYIVPNKDLITGRLLNWTLSDSLSRVTVTVGVSYEEEPTKVTKQLFEILEANTLVLRDPAPLVTFEGFDDSSLRFVVRAHVGSLDHRLEVIHQLHSEIFHQFREAEIEIAFPQLDLHIRSGQEDFLQMSSIPGSATDRMSADGSGNSK